MKITFGEKQIENFEGQALKDETGQPLYLSRLLSNMLMEKPEGDYVKKYEMAKKLYDMKPFDVDTSDYKLLEKAIDESKMAVLVKAQVKLELDKMKETKK